jgi:hypothetical protein
LPNCYSSTEQQRNSNEYLKQSDKSKGSGWNYSSMPSSKPRITLEAIEGLKAVNELTMAHKVHTIQIHQWKKQVFDELLGIFSSQRTRSQK